MSDTGERTEAPTPKRIAKARGEGRWAQSTCATAWITVILLVIPTLAAAQCAVGWLQLWRSSAQWAVVAAASPRAIAELEALRAQWLAWQGGWALVCEAWIAASIAAVASAAACGALGLAPAALAPRLDRLSWRSGIKQLAGKEGAAQAALALLACATILWSIWPGIRAMSALSSVALSLGSALAVIRDAFNVLWLRLIVGIGALALFDVWRQRRRMMQSLRMTPREIRDERAQAEGRPELRARRRQASSRMTRSVSAGAIRRATAVIANPTHVAVALRYAPPDIDVPIVVSRGADLAAALVRSIAALHDIPVIESPELARTLFARVALGEPIPDECFAAVAAVFALLLQTRGLLRGNDA